MILSVKSDVLIAFSLLSTPSTNTFAVLMFEEERLRAIRLSQKRSRLSDNNNSKATTPASITTTIERESVLKDNDEMASKNPRDVVGSISESNHNKMVLTEAKDKAETKTRDPTETCLESCHLSQQYVAPPRRQHRRSSQKEGKGSSVTIAEKRTPHNIPSYYHYSNLHHQTETGRV
jgi:hypothetical protein